MSRQALGRGLRALIPAGSERSQGQLREIPIDSIRPNPFQPRRQFDEESLEELAGSLREYGMLEPVIVRPAGAEYHLIVGERRWRAARRAGLSVVPAMIREVTDRELMQIALVENLQRENLNPIEEAEAFKRLIEEFGVTQEEVARVVGRSRPSVANGLRLLSLDKGIQEWVASGVLSTGHAKVLLGIAGLEERLQFAARVVDEGLSVRGLEEIIQKQRQEISSRKQPSQQSMKDPIVEEVEEQLRRILGTKVLLQSGKQRGKIVIEYYSPDDLDRIMGLLGVG